MATKKPTIESTEFALYYDDDEYYEETQDTLDRAVAVAEEVIRTDESTTSVTIKRIDYTTVAKVTAVPKVEYV